jgi:peptide/nickel transport system permease protein
MTRYIGQRLLSAIPVLLGILLVTFVIARVLLPGDPCVAALGEHANPQTCAAFRVRYGLDKSILTQFGIYLRDVAHGDLGTSFRYDRPVTAIMLERLPVTVELSLCALLFAVIVGVTLGVISAVRRNSMADVGTMLLANIGVSMPVFWLGLMLAYFFALVLKGTPISLPPSSQNTAGIVFTPLTQVWSVPASSGLLYGVVSFVSNMHIFNTLVTGNWSGLWDTIKHLILPASALGTIPMALIARMTRSSLLDVLGLDYVRTARAKGLRERAVVLRHAFRNALIPVVTIVGLSLGALLSGAVLTETVFDFAGVGSIMFDAIQARDYAIVQGFTLVIAIIYVLLNLAVDILYGFLDPRIRYS